MTVVGLDALDDPFLKQALCQLLHGFLQGFVQQPLHHRLGQQFGHLLAETPDRPHDERAYPRDGGRLDDGNRSRRRPVGGTRHGEAVRDLGGGERQSDDDRQLAVFDLVAEIGGALAHSGDALSEFVHRVVAVEQHGELSVRGVGGVAGQYRHRFAADPVQVRNEVLQCFGRGLVVLADPAGTGFTALRPLAAREI